MPSAVDSLGNRGVNDSPAVDSLDRTSVYEAPAIDNLGTEYFNADLEELPLSDPHVERCWEVDKIVMEMKLYPKFMMTMDRKLKKYNSSWANTLHALISVI